MKISVIIPTYNRCAMLKNALSSLVDQSISKDEYEVIVVDDGSSDNTKEMLTTFSDKLNLTYFFQEDKGNRVTLARNEGMARAKGEYIIFLDPDMIVGHTFIVGHLKVHEENSAKVRQNNCAGYAVVGYVYGYDFYGDFSDFHSVVDMSKPDESMNILNEKKMFLDFREYFYSKYNYCLETLHAPWSFFWTCNASVKRETALKTGGFDLDFKTWGMDDIEFAYRLHKQKPIFKLSREACGIHCPHKRNMKEDMKKNLQNQILFFRKHPTIITEFYTISDFMTIQEDYAQYLSMQKDDEVLYSTLLGEKSIHKLKSLIPAHTNVIIGCQEGSLLKTLNSAAGLESNPGLFKEAKKLNPQIPLYELAGVRTIFDDKSFVTSLILGLSSKIPDKYIPAVLAEANRISDICYWLSDIPFPKVNGFKITRKAKLNSAYKLYRVVKK